MKIELELSDNRLDLEFTPDDDDVLNVLSKFSMEGRNCYFKTPEKWSFDKLHPDVLALICLLIVQPFVGKRIEVPIPVSPYFSDLYYSIFKRELGPVNPSLSRRESPDDSIPALAFSGGTDSTAALALMPENTVAVFLDRSTSPRKRTMYDKDAAYWALDSIAAKGYHVMQVETNLEYIRNPVGFPVDVANAAPALLLSDTLGFDAIGFGTVLESAYGAGHETFRNYPEGHHFRVWGSLFRGVRLPFFLAVAGVSEVGTSIIVLNTEIGKYAQSCIRGKRRKPCLNCWKCFRKQLLEKMLNSEELTEEWLDMLFGIEEAKRFLSMFPIKHENVLAYATSQYSGQHRRLSLLRARVRGDVLETDWMKHWYPKSLEVIPEKYREGLQRRAIELLGEMDDEMQQTLEEWDMYPMLGDSYYYELHEGLVHELDEL